MPDVMMTVNEIANISTKPSLLMQLEKEYRSFVAQIDSVDEARFRERWLDGRWGVAEIVALHAGWLRELAEGLRLAQSGVLLEGIAWLRPEDEEGICYGLLAGKPKRQLLDDLEQAFRAFTSEARALPEAAYSETETIARIFGYTGICKFRLYASLIAAWHEGRIGEVL